MEQGYCDQVCAIGSVSMVLTERSEIAAQIARECGQVEMLLAARAVG